MRLFFVGVILCTVGSVVINLGQVLMRRSHLLIAPSRPTFSYLKSGAWWVAFTLFLAGNALDFLSLSFAPSSVVSPLGSLAILSSLFLSPLLLKERIFSALDPLSIALVGGGSALAVIFGEAGKGGQGGDAREWDVARVEELLVVPRAWIFVSACALLAFLTFFASWVVLGRLRREAAAEEGREDDGPSNAFLLASDAPKPAVRSRLNAGSSIALLSAGTFSGLTIIGARLLSQLLTGSHRKSSLKSWQLYAILAATLVTAVSQVHLFQCALSQSETLLVLPPFFALYVALSIAGSFCVFRDFSGFSTERAALFGLGAFLTVVGVVILCWSRNAGHTNLELRGSGEAPRRRLSTATARAKGGKYQRI